jgi:hypothetical protein
LQTFGLVTTAVDTSERGASAKVVNSEVVWTDAFVADEPPIGTLIDSTDAVVTDGPLVGSFIGPFFVVSNGGATELVVVELTIVSHELHIPRHTDLNRSATPASCAAHIWMSMQISLSSITPSQKYSAGAAELVELVNVVPSVDGAEVLVLVLISMALSGTEERMLFFVPMSVAVVGVEGVSVPVALIEV